MSGTVGDAGAYRIRLATADDAPVVHRLCVDHAAYERADPPPADLVDRLVTVLSAPRPRLTCLLVENGDGDVVGYATCVDEFDPVAAEGFLHMDCLYLDEPYRGRGLGRRLIDRLADLARDRGLPTVRWQTPPWNVDAVGFYRRLGASGTAAHQFTVPTV